MLDIKHYAQTSLNQQEAELFIKCFGKYKFGSLWQMIKQLENIEEKLDWVDKEDFKHKLVGLCRKLAGILNDSLPSLSDKIKFLEDHIDIVPQFPEFEWKSAAHGGYCPQCGERELFVPEQGQAKSIKCSRENNCGYSSHIFNYLKDNQGMAVNDALNELASRCGVDMKSYGVTFEVHTQDTQPEINYRTHKKAVSRSPRVEEKIEYMTFDSYKEYKEVDFNKILPKYTEMTNKQKFMMTISAIYYYSLQTEQNGKALYYKSRGISSVDCPILTSKVKQIVDEIGFLDYKKDVPGLLAYLTNTFPLEDLVEFGIINDSEHRVPYSFKHYSEGGFCVIPNKDLYTNMITGLKLRNTKLAKWQDKSQKEPEMSFKRIATPIPYGLTAVSLKNGNSFRLQEGSVDTFSLPSKENTTDVAIAGVNGIDKSILGLFKNKKVEICFDQDNAGQTAAVGSIKFNLTNHTFELDFKTKSLVAELEGLKFNDAIKIEKTENKITIKEIRFPNNEANAQRIKTLKTVLERRGDVEFKLTRTLGLKHELEKAGAIVSNKTWNTKYGFDVNEVLQAGYIEKIID